MRNTVVMRRFAFAVMDRALQSRLIWATGIALAVAGTLSAVIGLIGPDLGLYASIPFVALALRWLDTRDDSSIPTGVDPANLPAVIEHPKGDMSSPTPGL